MTGRSTHTPRRAHGDRGVWPVAVVALAAALVPTACVLGFMTAAMRNEQLAVRQRLADVYQQKLQADQKEIASFWSARSYFTLRTQDDSTPPVELFAQLVREGNIDSAVILDDAGIPAYPTGPRIVVSEEPIPSLHWREARRYEFELEDYQQAEEAYARAADEPGLADPAVTAQLMISRARCLARAGHTEDAMRILLEDLSGSALPLARDHFGRVITLDAQLHALELMPPGDNRCSTLAVQLAEQVNAYDAGPLTPPATQRLHVMERLVATAAEGPVFPTLNAERLAQQYLAQTMGTPQPHRLTPAGVPGLWRTASADGRVILLLRDARVFKDLATAARLDEPFAGITTVLHRPGEGRNGEEPFLRIPASEYLPGWTLAAYLDEDPFASSAARAQMAYLIAGVSATGVIVALAAAVASYLGKQIKLTRLKNNLIATVSHELKTPLASMRVLVDTLQEGRTRDAAQAGEYLALIARENQRLSRLIDNFLAFSRMERHKRAFAFAPTDLADVVHTAVAAVSERFSTPGAHLDVDLSAHLPAIRGDEDALVTVAVNLLDNAWKYTGETKRVSIRAFAADGHVCLEVADNGLGMTRRAQRRVFDTFYQVDQTLARRVGGCGLGLAIVKFILDAHDGTIRVRSQLGKGTTFTVRLPAASHAAAAPPAG